jgi:hypothetical protein
MLPRDQKLLRGRVRSQSWPALLLLIGCFIAGPRGRAQQQPATIAPNPVTASISPTLPQTASPGNASGAITGSVTETSGAAPRETLSGSDGRFAFQNVAPGAFTVTVTLQGFDAACANGNLQPGQLYDLKPIALQLATVSAEVEVVPSEVLAQQQVHAEEQQRLLGAFPNFFVTYDSNAQPLTPRQKFSLSWHNAIDPGNLLLVGGLAGVQQAENAFPGYGQGAEGYGDRYGADLGNLVSGTFMGGAVLPTLFHQDPRYFYKGTGSIRSRLLYSLESAVICRGDNGHRQPAFASVLGDLSAGAISNLYYAPSDRQGATLTLENGFLGVAGDALNNIFQEFFSRKLTSKAGKFKPQP